MRGHGSEESAFLFSSKASFTPLLSKSMLHGAEGVYGGCFPSRESEIQLQELEGTPVSDQHGHIASEDLRITHLVRTGWYVANLDRICSWQRFGRDDLSFGQQPVLSITAVVVLCIGSRGLDGVPHCYGMAFLHLVLASNPDSCGFLVPCFRHA